MNNLHTYQVRFFDPQGALQEIVPLLAETLEVATDCARGIATDIGAANFTITSKPDRETPMEGAAFSGRPAGTQFGAYGLFALFAASIIISLWA